MDTRANTNLIICTKTELGCVFFLVPLLHLRLFVVVVVVLSVILGQLMLLFHGPERATTDIVVFKLQDSIALDPHLALPSCFYLLASAVLLHVSEVAAQL